MQYEQWGYCLQPLKISVLPLKMAVLDIGPSSFVLICYSIYRNENVLASCVADGADFSCEFKCNLNFLFLIFMAFQLIVDIYTRKLMRSWPTDFNLTLEE